MEIPQSLKPFKYIFSNTWRINKENILDIIVQTSLLLNYNDILE